MNVKVEKRKLPAVEFENEAKKVVWKQRRRRWWRRSRSWSESTRPGNPELRQDPEYSAGDSLPFFISILVPKKIVSKTKFSSKKIKNLAEKLSISMLRLAEKTQSPLSLFRSLWWRREKCEREKERVLCYISFFFLVKSWASKGSTWRRFYTCQCHQPNATSARGR